jgi:hypothetical protein
VLRASEQLSARSTGCASCGMIPRGVSDPQVAPSAQWWFETIQLWDYIPAEHVILHPQIVWNQLYKEIYLPEMKLWGSAPALGHKRVLSDGAKANAPGSWFEARTIGMRMISMKETGVNQATGEPNLNLKLQEYANHAKYGECSICGMWRRAKEHAIKLQMPRSEKEHIRGMHLTHIEFSHAERRTIASMRNETFRVRDTVFEVCGVCVCLPGHSSDMLAPRAHPRCPAPALPPYI